MKAHYESKPFQNTDAACTLTGKGLGVNASAFTFIRAGTPDMLIETARGKNTYASPCAFNDTSDLTVDGNTTTYYHSEPGIVFPWWVVDLGNTYLVYQVKILPRPGYYAYRFHNIEVRVGNTREESGHFSSFRLFSTYNEYYSDTLETLCCYRRDGVAGRYISIQRVTPEDDMLHMVEVQVLVLQE
ncbi:pentraxin fusion protein-like [Procambarus clarkii]|uniref:pentraxin fusion protein-like n=1 Tax=Procambarus clarkii TaxID=6728 RepID=UPI003742F297